MVKGDIPHRSTVSEVAKLSAINSQLGQESFSKLGFPAINAACVVPTPALEIPNWYAVYTCARHEKYVARQLEERSIDVFLPLYRSWRRWKDRRKEIELALFPGYVFVRTVLQNRLTVLQLPGVVRFVSFNNRPVPLPVEEIEALRGGLEQNSTPNRTRTCRRGEGCAWYVGRWPEPRESWSAGKTASGW